MKTNKLLVTEIQHFCMHDGPGVRTTVFLKGCPLHCKWCHNPETQSDKPQILFSIQKCLYCGSCVSMCPCNLHTIVPNREFNRTLCISCGKCTDVCPTNALTLIGNEMTVKEIIDIVKCDIAFYGNDGGITISGGEPLIQSKMLKELLISAKELNISTCIETSGMVSTDAISEIIDYVDLFLYDIKDTDEIRLKENTGGNYTKILENLKYIDNLQKNTILRCILIPEININNNHVRKISDIYANMKHCEYVELLPYHPYGSSKAEQIGKSQITYNIPAKDQILDFAKSLQKFNVPVKCFGKMVK